VNFHKCHAPFSTKLSQSRTSQVLCRMCSENGHWCAQNTDNGFISDIFRMMAMKFLVMSCE
jgi:hypothetical protein